MSNTYSQIRHFFNNMRLVKFTRVEFEQVEIGPRDHDVPEKQVEMVQAKESRRPHESQNVKLEPRQNPRFRDRG